MNAAISLTLHDVFPNEEAYDIDYYTKGISKQRLIEVAVYLIYLSDASNELRFDWKELLLNFWFDSDELDTAKDIYLRVRFLESRTIPERQDVNYKYVFLNQISALTLLEHIIKKDDRSTFSTEEELPGSNLNLFKLILRINSDFTEKVEVKESFYNKYTSDYLLSLYIPISMAQYEVYNSNNFRLLYTYTMQQIKSLYLFEFLENSNPELRKLLLEKYNCDSVKEYFQLFIKIIQAIFLRATNRDNKRLREPSSFNYSEEDVKAITFTDSFIISRPDVNENELDFKHLRASPIVKFSNGNYAIISEVFAIQKIYNGLYFELKEIYENKMGNKVNTFRPYFTTNFSESFLLYKVLRNIFSKRSYLQFTGDEIKESYLKNGGPDYYIRNGNKIFLFENKDNFIAPTAKTSYNFKKIVEDINKKIISEGKGIPQIIKNIKHILNKNYLFDSSYNVQTCRIYPILVTHRTEFDASGLNRYVNEKFADELKNLETEGYYVKNIQPLILVNIDTLLLNQFLLDSRQLKIEDLIDDYFKFIYSTTYKNITIENRDTKVHEKYYSFSDYILSVYAHNKKIIYKNELLKWTKKYFKNELFN